MNKGIDHGKSGPGGPLNGWKGAFTVLLLLALCMTALTAIPRGAEAVNPPLYVVGFILDDEGNPVNGSTVLLVSGTVTDSTESNETGAYTLDATEAGDGATIYIFAQNGTDTGSITFTADIDAQEDNHNVTLGSFSDHFLTTIFCFDSEGVGVANVSVNVTLAGVTVATLTTNETGYATTALGVGNYEFTAETDNSTLRDQIGEFDIIDEDAVVLIDMTGVTERVLNLLGYEISGTCLFIFVVALGFVLGIILLGHAKIDGKGAMSTVTLLIIVIIGIVLLVLLTRGTDDFDFSITGILDYLGIETGTLGSNTIAVGTFHCLIGFAMGCMGFALGALSYSGGMDSKSVLWFSMLIVALASFACLLVPGYPTFAYYGVVVGLVLTAVLVVFHIMKDASPTGENAAICTMLLWAGVVVAALLGIMNAINGGDLFV